MSNTYTHNLIVFTNLLILCLILITLNHGYHMLHFIKQPNENYYATKLTMSLQRLTLSPCYPRYPLCTIHHHFMQKYNRL